MRSLDVSANSQHTTSLAKVLSSSRPFERAGRGADEYLWYSIFDENVSKEGLGQWWIYMTIGESR